MLREMSREAFIKFKKIGPEEILGVHNPPILMHRLNPFSRLGFGLRVLSRTGFGWLRR